MTLHSYVVRYDSGFAPNPFYGHCTLATCKPDIRRHAKVGDWVLGTGSDDRSIRRGGYLVYAMCITEILSFSAYDSDMRFQRKKPYRRGSRKQSCGDNIYWRDPDAGVWRQRDSFHSLQNGQTNPKHVARDTSVDRVLISSDFIYFGGSGPAVSRQLRESNAKDICKKGRGRARFDDEDTLIGFVQWIRSLGCAGYQGAPFEWKGIRNE